MGSDWDKFWALRSHNIIGPFQPVWVRIISRQSSWVDGSGWVVGIYTTRLVGWTSIYQLQAVWCENDSTRVLTQTRMFFRSCVILVEDSRTSSDAPYRIPEHAVSVHLGPSLACTLSYLDFLDFHQSSGRKTWNDSEWPWRSETIRPE